MATARSARALFTLNGELNELACVADGRREARDCGDPCDAFT
jgi:hypothetical protein